MTHRVRGFGLAATLAFVSTFAFGPQANAQSPSAFVYVQSQGPAGPVYGYSTAANGQLTPIPGSPFKPGTEIVGATSSHFFTIGKTLLHSYALGSNGAIGSQQSQIAFLDYSGSACGGGSNGLATAVLDHSGQYIYVLLQNGGDGTCSAYQTYKVNSDGSFTFMGDSEVTYASGDGTDNPSILGNETFAYADHYSGHNNGIIGFQRQSTGTLEYSGPLNPTFSGSENYTPYYPDASPAGNYVVLQLDANDSNPSQLGSFTVASDGTLSSTNTPSNMPTSQLIGPYSTFSTDGSMFALYADAMDGAGNHGNGIEIYNFNGASPLTLNTTALNGTPVDQAAWDTSNHLYAYSRSENKLWVFNVTPSSIAATAPTSITSPFAMVVVGRTANTGGGGAGGSCSAPTGEGVNVCSPAENATVTSPVQINAAANVTGGVYRFELWNGNTKLASVSNSGTMDQAVTLSPGTYHLVFDAYNSSGDHQKTTRDITVTGSGTGGACTAPSTQGVNVCTPDENSTVTSPVQINAAANVTGGVYRFELWNGSTKLASVSNSGIMNQSVALAPGTYHLTFDARSSSGDHQYAYRDITVSSSGGTATTQYSAPVFSTQTAWTAAGNGQIKVDTQGMVAIQLTNASAGKSYAVQFCEAVNPAHSNLPSSCMAITTVTTDGSGNASTTLKFPQPGDWAGDFVFVDSSGNTDYATSIAAGYGSYMATLLPDSQTNGGLVTTSSPQLPLTSGTVTVSGSVATYTVKGASPNAYYAGNESETTYIDSSGTYDIASMTTDAQGNGTMTGSLSNGSGGDIFQVEPQSSGAGYTAGFTIP